MKKLRRRLDPAHSLGRVVAVLLALLATTSALSAPGQSPKPEQRRLPTEHYPYAVAAARDGAAYVSAWGGRSISVFRTRQGGGLSYSGLIGVGRHPFIYCVWAVETV